MSQLQQKHLDLATHILRYLKQTADLRLLYNYNKPLLLSDQIDADWGSCPETTKSIGAYLFNISGSPVSWQSKKLLTISRSSTELKYWALSDGVQEALCISHLLGEIEVLPQHRVEVHRKTSQISKDLEPSIIVHCGNQSAIKLAKNLVFLARSNYLKIHYHFIRE